MGVLDSLVGALGVGTAQTAIGDVAQGIMNPILQGQNINASEELSSYNEAEAEKYWMDTNYPAQVQEAEAAGLNPALLYAKGGTGGSTLNTGMQVQTAAAPVQIPAAQIYQQQEQLNQNQESIENLKKVQDAQTDLLKADTGNTEADTAIKNTNLQLQQIAVDIAGKTEQEQIGTIKQGFENIQNLGKSLRAAGITDEALIATKIGQANQTLTNSMLDGIIKGTQNEELKTEVKLNQAQIGKIANDIINSKEFVQQGWANVHVNEGNLAVGQANSRVNQYNALTTEGRLEFDKAVHNISDSTKMNFQFVQQILGAVLNMAGKAVE